MKPRKSDRLWLLGVLLLTAASYSPILRNDFINRDDPSYIHENPLIRGPLGEAAVAIFKTPEYEGDYHPLTLLGFSVQYNFFGDSPAGYHATSLLLHLAVTSLVFLAAVRLTASAPVALLAAAMFGLHPAHVESVAWASQQKDLLYSLFYLLALVSYVGHVRTGSPAQYAAALLFFLLSLLSKTMAVSFAAVIFLLDISCERRADLATLAAKIPFLLLAIGFGLWSVKAHASYIVSPDLLAYGAADRVILAGKAGTDYLAQVFFPGNLSAYHPYPFAAGTAPPSFWAFPAGLGLASAAVFYLFRRRKIVVLGYGFFLLNIAVIVQFFPFSGAFEADRYTYLASFGLLLIAASGWQRLTESNIHLPSPRTWLVAMACALLLGAGWETYQRAGIWRNSFSLWSDAIAKYPDVPFLYAYRAEARSLPEEATETLQDYRTAIRLHPGLGIAYYGIGRVYALTSKPDSALPYFSLALRLNYEPKASLTGRGAALMALGKTDSAIQDFTGAIALDSGYVEAYYNRANAYLTVSDYRRAISDLDVVVHRDPGDAASLYNRGLAKLFLGDTTAGCEDFDRSASLKFPAAPAMVDKYCR